MIHSRDMKNIFRKIPEIYPEIQHIHDFILAQYGKRGLCCGSVPVPVENLFYESLRNNEKFRAKLVESNDLKGEQRFFYKGAPCVVYL